MTVTRRFPAALTTLALAFFLVVLSGAFHSAHAQGATVDWPTGYGKAVQAPGDIESEPVTTASVVGTARLLVPGGATFTPSLTFWPSASRLAQWAPTRSSDRAVLRRPTLGPAARQRTLVR